MFGKITTEKAVSKLQKELKTDAELRRGYRANIAMAFKDEFSRKKKEKKGRLMSTDDIHEIANTAAENFIENFCR